MKYLGSISSIFVLSVGTLVLLFIGLFILNSLNAPEWCVVIPYVVILMYSVFKTKNWHVVFGMLLTLVYIFAFAMIAARSFAD
jgi:4-hydroxybenzoate polyprenyltransferase